jgi:hemolysin activation/secretion protein
VVKILIKKNKPANHSGRNFAMTYIPKKDTKCEFSDLHKNRLRTSCAAIYLASLVFLPTLAFSSVLAQATDVVTNASANLTSSQSIAQPTTSVTKDIYTIPSVPEREEMDEGDKIKVSSIHLVEVLGLKADGGYIEEDVIDDIIAAKTVEKIAQENGQMTFEQLSDLASDISKYLIKDKDYLLATVYLPAQKVEGGVVKFALLKGKLGEVEVIGNDIYDKDTLEAVFADHMGKVVRKRKAEEMLYGLLDLPGMAVSGEFSPGTDLGYTKLTLKAIETRYDSMVFIDDSGSEFTGKIRAGTQFKFNNLLGFKDELSVLLYSTQTPQGIENDSKLGSIDCCDGSLAYSFGLGSSNKFRGSLEVSKANYDVGNVEDLTLATFGFAGETLSITAATRYQLVRGKTHNSALYFNLSKMNAKTQRLNQLLSEDNILVYQSGYEFDLTDGFMIDEGKFYANRSAVSVQLSRGKLSKGDAGKSRLEADDDFTKITYSLNRAQRLGDKLNLNMRLNGQFTRNQLVGAQQMGIGGPSSVRAYPTGAFLADKGTYAALDLVWDAGDLYTGSLLKLLDMSGESKISPYFFVDYAEAKVVEGETFAVKQVGLGSYGLGLNWQFGKMSFDFTVAKALGSSRELSISTSEGGQDVVGRQNTQLYASIKQLF